jgi:hypothetical protein
MQKILWVSRSYQKSVNGWFTSPQIDARVRAYFRAASGRSAVFDIEANLYVISLFGRIKQWRTGIKLAEIIIAEAKSLFPPRRSGSGHT